MSRKVLADRGFSVGDIVTYASDKESTGGVIFQISENCDPVVPFATKPVVSTDPRWVIYEKTYGPRSKFPIDEKGKRIEPMRIEGYVRLKPIFSFFPTELGTKPKGKGTTILLYHRYLSQVKKVDLVLLGTRYMELGTLIRDLAVTHGMVLGPTQDQNGAHDSPQE